MVLPDMFHPAWASFTSKSWDFSDLSTSIHDIALGKGQSPSHTKPYVLATTFVFPSPVLGVDLKAWTIERTRMSWNCLIRKILWLYTQPMTTWGFEVEEIYLDVIIVDYNGALGFPIYSWIFGCLLIRWFVFFVLPDHWTAFVRDYEIQSSASFLGTFSPSCFNAVEIHRMELW